MKALSKNISEERNGVRKTKVFGQANVSFKNILCIRIHEICIAK